MAGGQFQYSTSVLIHKSKMEIGENCNLSGKPGMRIGDFPRFDPDF